MADDLFAALGGGESEEDFDWRSGGDPADYLFARDSWHSIDDFTGRAQILEAADADEGLKIDLFVRNVDIRLEEHIQVSNHLGDSFGITCFGKAPMKVVFSAILADTGKNYSKLYLIDAWKNKLRLSAVARRGKIPALRMGSHLLQGPFVAMEITENADSEDTLTAVFTMLLTGLGIAGTESTLFFDYVHGVEAENPAQFLDNPLNVGEVELSLSQDEEETAQEDSGEARQDALPPFMDPAENPLAEFLPPFMNPSP